MRIVAALGGNALLERTQTPDAYPHNTQPPPEDGHA